MASASTSTSTHKQIVVIGGGGAGFSTAADLAKKVDSTKVAVTLVSARPHYTHMPATLRMVVGPTDDLENRALVPLDRVFANTPAGKFKLGKVVEVTKDEQGKSGSVVLEDGEKLPWDYLVVASGSKWEGAIDFPATKEETSAHIKSWREKFEKAKHVALIGGGAVGVELAGEIKDVYPDKKVTIIHKGKLLLNPTYPDKYRNAVAKTALRRGVELILEDSVADLPESGGGVVDGITTAKGVAIPADLVTATRGWTPNTSFLANIPGALNEAGQFKMLPTFQSAVAPHIFALGDVTDYKEQKQLGKIYSQTPIVSSNILSMLQGKAPTAKYTGGVEAIVLTSGKYAGNMHVPFLGGLNMGNWVTSNVKGKGLFVNMQRKALGYP